MESVDVIITVINVILAVASSIGAYNSIKYFKKSHNLTIYAQTNNALVEIQKMLIKLPEALVASNVSNRNKKGFSLENTICSIGHELMNSLTEIRSSIPQEYSDEFKELENEASFQLQRYLNSYISGEAITESGISSLEYNLCQTRLVDMQDFLKKKTSEIAEKLK